jgi:hypothetical protein
MFEPERLRPTIRLNADAPLGLAGAPNKGRSPSTKQFEIDVDVVIGGNGIEHKIEAARVFLHLVGIPGNDDFIGTEAESVFLFVWRGGEHDNVRSERMCKLHSHVTQPSETD